MTAFTGPVEAILALQAFLLDRVEVIPNRINDELRAAIAERSTVVGTHRAVELIYARQIRKDDMPEALREWAAAASVMMEDNGFHAFDQDSKGSRVARVLRKQTLAKAKWPAEDPVIAERASPTPPEDTGAPESAPEPAPEPMPAPDPEAPAFAPEPAGDGA